MGDGDILPWLSVILAHNQLVDTNTMRDDLDFRLSVMVLPFEGLSLSLSLSLSLF